MLIRGSSRLAGHWESNPSTRLCSFFSLVPDFKKKKTTKNPIKHRFGKDGCDSTAVGKAACLNRVSKFLWKGFSHFPTEFAGRNHNNMIHVGFFFHGTHFENMKCLSGNSGEGTGLCAEVKSETGEMPSVLTELLRNSPL